MEVSEQDTKRFLETLWYQWGTAIIETICKEFDIPDDIKQELYNKYMRPNDWRIEIESNS